MRTLRVGLAQINTTVGDFEGNVAKVLEYVGRARDLGVDIVSFPELTVTGYPPEDLLLRRSFVKDNQEALAAVVKGCGGITAVVGFVDNDGGIYNSAAVVHDGRLADVYHKQRLPNYGVFDEMRYFRPGESLPVYTVAGVDVGVNVCEDIWYPGDPACAQSLAGAQVVVNINGSPFYAGKRSFRQEMLATRARDYDLFVCYTNQVGGQDELVFDGGSMVLSPGGGLVAQAAMFEEELLVCDLELDEPRRREKQAAVRRVTLSDSPFVSEKPALEPRLAPGLEGEAEVYAALVTGTRDYVRKTGFQKVVIALSGGIDSSLVAAVAVDAIGKENVVGVSMPSRYSSEGSIRDAQELAERLGMELMIIPIEPAHAAYLEMLERAFAGTESGVAEENVQTRIRGNVVMALSNKFEWLVLTTGNKSEMATGYATLYGDMAGGFAVIKDVPKTLVYRLARQRNTWEDGPVISEKVIEKPPSAELKPGQLDQDTLPAYEELDPVLEAYVEDDKNAEEIVEMGYDRELVVRVIRMVNRNEYKRRQAPPGVKITPRAFGRDRRLPIANRYEGL